jgi:hypothetical protein
MMLSLLQSPDDMRLFIRSNGLEIISAAIPHQHQPGMPTERFWSIVEKAMRILALGADWVDSVEDAEDAKIAIRAKASWQAKVCLPHSTGSVCRLSVSYGIWN